MKYFKETLFTSVLLAVLCPYGYDAILQYPPSIVKQPPTDEVLFQVATQQNDNEKPFMIECEAEGEPTPRYRWVKNGKEFNYQAYDDRMSQQPGRGTLVITSPRDEDLGQYQCFAENEWGIATSNSVFVRKAELNSFKDESATAVYAKEGEPFKLTCQPPDGWPKPSVYWLILDSNGAIKSINSSRMTLDPEGNLWFSNVTRQDSSDDFTYCCAATSPFRTEYKIGSKIILHVQPTGSAPGQNRYPPEQQYVTRKKEIALRDKKVELFCIFGGTPLPQTVWSKGGIPIQSSEHISQGNYGKSLIIKHVTFEDQGTYACEVSNGVGDAKSYSIDLTVLAVPYFTEEPEIVNAAEEETAVFRCSASGNPEPQIHWIHNGKPISEAPPNPRRKVSNNMIVIEKLQKKDTGNYGCNATNSLGYVYKDVYVNVLALSPEITEPPSDVQTVEGAIVTITCRVFGSPRPRVKWILNNMELTGGRFTTLESGDLRIMNVGFMDEGHYTCYAENKLGNVSASANLTVETPTRIRDRPVDYEVAAGDPATFRCSAEAYDKYTIDWARNTELIDFETQPRFVKTYDNSLTITKTIELDSGVYTCIASTPLDNATAQATLIVQDKPNAPQVLSVRCNLKDATISWQPMGDNRAPILKYIIQYNTSFTPDSWTQLESVPGSDTTYTVPLSSWANYTFRVIAINKIGESIPSTASSPCTTQPDVPHKNPDNVVVRGTEPNNVVITWTPMSMIEHNGPRFHYKVSWMRLVPGDTWKSEEVLDWRKGELKIINQPVYQPYKATVVAINEKGQANVAPKEVFGYSGEDVPTQAPANLTLLEILDSDTVSLAWHPVPLETIRGHFEGYKVQTWTDVDGERGMREVEVKGNNTRASINKLIPYSKNYVRVLAFNGRYNGPPSDVISVDMPEGVPDAVPYMEAQPFGSSALYLTWKPPYQTNGILTGYNIYYRPLNETYFGELSARDPQITDPNRTSAKLAGLIPGTRYRIYINATTSKGEGAPYSIETRVGGVGSRPLQIPVFSVQRIYTSEIFPAVKIHYKPEDNLNSGSHFYVKYRVKGRPFYEKSEIMKDQDFKEIRGLQPGELYEFVVSAVDGEHVIDSHPMEIEMHAPDSPIIQAKENLATAGWFVGMMLAIAFLIIILILVCLVKRNRGGKYVVHEREAANGRHDYPDDPGFQEYHQPLGTQRPPRGSASGGERKPPAESDTDSMAEYGEGDTDGMNEDGSFIGIYGKKRKQPETSSAAFATLV